MSVSEVYAETFDTKNLSLLVRGNLESTLETRCIMDHSNTNQCSGQIWAETQMREDWMVQTSGKCALLI